MSKEGIFGIDVSEHQNIINWDIVKNKIQYAIIRIGWIGNKDLYLDKQFERNYSECKRLNIPIGIYVYNYCKSNERLEVGINWILEQLKDKEINLPIFLDMEDSSIREIGSEALTEQCLIFCEKIEKANYKSGIYANLDWFNHVLNINKLNELNLWLAQWTKRKKHSADFEIQMWQYGQEEIEGIDGDVDVNVLLEDLISEETPKEQNQNIEYKIEDVVTNEVIEEQKDEVTYTVKPRG